jgi:uncharacterized repeat protein (TIGR03833 family)
MSGDAGLKHKAFSSLRGLAAAPRAPEPCARSAPQAALGRLIVREEFDSAEAKVVVRVIGVPPAEIKAVGSRIREALGCVVLMEGRDLLVMAALCEQAAEWLRGAGAQQTVVVRRVVAANPPDTGQPGGTERSRIRRGLRVAIVMKADQESGALTEGVVRDILTSSANHPRGIKVRLESGQIGRVRRILS